MTVRRTSQIYTVSMEQRRPNRDPTFEELLLKLSLGDLDLDRLVNLLGMAPLVVCVVLDCGREEGIDECSLAQS